MSHLLAQAKAFEDEHAAEQFSVEYSRIVSSSSTTTTPGGKRPRDGGDNNIDNAGAGLFSKTSEDTLSHYGLLDLEQATAEKSKMEVAMRALYKQRTILIRSLAESRKQFIDLDTDAKHTKGVEMATEMKSVNGTLVAAPKNHEITQAFKKMQEEREAVVKKIESYQVARITVNRDIGRLRARGQERRGIFEGLVQLCEQAPFEDGSSSNFNQEAGDNYQLPPIEKDPTITANDIAAAATSMSCKTSSSSASQQQFHKGNPYGKTVLVMDPSQSVLTGKGPSLTDRPGGKGKDASSSATSVAASAAPSGGGGGGGAPPRSAEDIANAEVLNRYRSRLDAIGRLRRQAGFMAMSPLERVRAEMEALQAKRNKFHRNRE